MDRTELSFALSNFASDATNQESHRNLAGIIGRAMDSLAFPERQNICPLLPHLVVAALANATETSDPKVTQWRDAMEALTGRRFVTPAALNGLANDAMATARVIGGIIERVTHGGVLAIEVYSLLHAAWNLVDANAAEFFASSEFNKLNRQASDSATGSFDCVTLRFMRQGDKVILTLSTREGEATFISLCAGHGTLYSVSGSLTPDQITLMTTKVMMHWTEASMVAV